MEALTTTFLPDAKTWGQTIKLSPIDQIAPRDYNVLSLFFRLPDGADNWKISKNLQAGLFKTIQEIPQLACAVAKSPNDREELELIWTPASGASIVFKDYTNSTLWPHGPFADLERQRFPISTIARDLVLGLDDKDGAAQIPSLVIQANFIPRGLILSTCLHHALCDGLGLFMFHQALSRHTAEAAMGSATVSAKAGAISFTERENIIEPEPEVSLTDLPHWRLASGDNFLKPTSYGSKLPHVKYAMYFLSEKKAVCLRNRLGEMAGKHLSTVEALGAFLWMHVLRARNIDPIKYPQAKLSITVDARGRMTEPVVSRRYWGNFSEPNAVACVNTASLCYQSTPNQDWSATLPQAASAIKQSIAAVDNAAVRRLAGLLGQMPKATSLTWNVDRWPGPDMLIVCLNDFRYNHLDFGPGLGYSEAVRVTVGNTEGKPDGRCLLMPPRRCDGRGVEIALQYDIDTLVRLKQSKDFGEYLDWLN